MSDKVVLDTETGGLVAGWHEIIEICIIPLTDRYAPDPSKEMFHTTVRPEFPERVEMGALIANGRIPRDAPDKSAAYAEAMEKIMEYPTRRDTIIAFVEWYKNVMNGEKLAWLCQNGKFDMGFLEHWFMPTHANGVSFSSFFNYQGRDTQRIAMFMMDRAKIRGDKMPLAGVSLEKICQSMGIVNEAPHTSLGDAKATAAVYRNFLGIKD